MYSRFRVFTAVCATSARAAAREPPPLPSSGEICYIGVTTAEYPPLQRDPCRPTQGTHEARRPTMKRG